MNSSLNQQIAELEARKAFVERQKQISELEARKAKYTQPTPDEGTSWDSIKKSIKNQLGVTGPITAGKALGTAGRVAASIPGSIPDLAAFPVNLASLAFKGEPLIPSVSAKLIDKYDQATGEKYKPTTDRGEILFDIASSLGSGLGIGGIAKGAGKLTSKVPKLRKVLEQSGKLTPGNIGAVTGGVAATHNISKNEQKKAERAALEGKPYEPSYIKLILGGLAGGLAGGAASGTVPALTKGAVNIAKDPTLVANALKDLSDLRIHAALRKTKGLANTVIDVMPKLHGFGRSNKKVRKDRQETIGRIGIKSAENYMKRVTPEFKKEYGKINSQFKDLIGKQHDAQAFANIPGEEPSKLINPQVSLGEPIAKLIDRLEVALKDPATSENFLKGPLGQVLADLMGIPGELTEAKIKEAFTPPAKKPPTIIESTLVDPITNKPYQYKVPPPPTKPWINPMKRTVDYDTAHRLKQDLDERLSSNQWHQVGGHAPTIRELRGDIANEYVNTFQKYSPELGKRLRKVDKKYGSHMDYDAPWVEGLRAAKGHVGKAANVALKDVQGERGTGEHLGRLFRDIGPKEKKIVSDYILRDLGKHKGNFHVRNFEHNFGNLKEGAQEKLRKNTSPETWESAKKMIKRTESLRKIRQEERGLADVAGSTQAIGKWNTFKKQLWQKALNAIGTGVETPDGVARALEILDRKALQPTTILNLRDLRAAAAKNRTPASLVLPNQLYKSGLASQLHKAPWNEDMEDVKERLKVNIGNPTKIIS